MGNMGGFTEESRRVVLFIGFGSGKRVCKVLGKVKYLFLVVPEYIILFCLFCFKFLCNLFIVIYIAGQNFVLPILVSINMRYVSPEHYLFICFNLLCIRLRRWYSV